MTLVLVWRALLSQKELYSSRPILDIIGNRADIRRSFVWDVQVYDTSLFNVYLCVMGGLTASKNIVMKAHCQHQVKERNNMTELFIATKMAKLGRRNKGIVFMMVMMLKSVEARRCLPRRFMQKRS